MQEQIETLQTADTQKGQQIGSMAAQFAKLQQRQRVSYMVLGFIAGTTVWFFNSTIYQVLSAKWPNLGQSPYVVQAVIGSIGSLIFTLPVIPFIGHLTWRPEIKVALLTCVVAVAIAFSKLLDAATWSAWSAYVTVATVIAAVLVFGIFRRNSSG